MTKLASCQPVKSLAQPSTNGKASPTFSTRVQEALQLYMAHKFLYLGATLAKIKEAELYSHTSREILHGGNYLIVYTRDCKGFSLSPIQAIPHRYSYLKEKQVVANLNQWYN